ncbi:MAG: serine/threonine protein kinase [Deltaproteobacteria bacterium]|nr:serine/threonine protein kinase [Deltaproteobacteria bacterium]
MKTIAGYRVLAELARGGMGIVRLAQPPAGQGAGELVVLKELRPELASDAAYRDMFVDEGRLAVTLQHAHIVRTHELLCDGGRWLIAMELLRGVSLHQLRTKLGARGLPGRFAVRILAAVLDGLEHAHERGIVHRDVSAQNVFLGWDGTVKLIDFGVAKVDARRATQVGVVKGCVPYLSPDHLEPKTIDRRADVFSAGVVLCELLTGARLWGELDELTILKRLLAHEIPAWPMTESGIAIPPGLRRTVERALAPRREDRFQSAREMREALEVFLGATDAQGSLEEVGVWLSRTLAPEKAAFEAFVARASCPVPPPLPRERWLPSTDLVTRLHSLPPRAPRLPPPPRASRPQRIGIGLHASRLRRIRMPLVALVASIVVGLAIGAYFGNEAVDSRSDRTAQTAGE